MTDPFVRDHVVAERKRAQSRQAAWIIGIDAAYLARMLDFFGARVCLDRRLGRFCTDRADDERARQRARVLAFWRKIVLYEDGYTGDLVELHRNLQDIRHEDFRRWLTLLRATLEETAPTPEAANYLMARATRAAQDLETAILARSGNAVAIPRVQRAAGDTA